MMAIDGGFGKVDVHFLFSFLDLLIGGACFSSSVFVVSLYLKCGVSCGRQGI